MSVPALSLIVPVLLAAAGFVRVEGGATSSVIVRSVRTFGPLPPGLVGVTTDPADYDSAELFLLPRLALVHGTAERVQLTYAPRLSMPAMLTDVPGLPGPLDRLAVSHRLDLLVELGRADLRYRTLASAEMGQVDQLAPAQAAAQAAAPAGGAGGAPRPNAQPGQTSRKLDYRGFMVQLGMDGRIDRRSGWTVLATGTRGGGRTTEALAILPLQEEARVESTVLFGLGARDTISALASGSITRTEGAAAATEIPASLARAGLGIQHAFDKRLTARAGGGVAATYAAYARPGKPDLVPRHVLTTPFANAGLDWNPGPRLPVVAFVLDAGTAIDRVAGTAQLTAGSFLRLTWVPARRWTTTAGTGFGIFEPFLGLGAVGQTGQITRTATASAGVAYAFIPEVSVNATVGWTFQTTARIDLRPYREVNGTLGLAAALP